jgi:pimeloyl-ACP methyl ester carboxylesterase
VVPERILLAAAAPFLRQRSKNPRVVLVLPGLGATDRSTQPLRDILTRQGHQAYGWELGRHGIWTRESVAAVEHRLLWLTDWHQTPITLVGISAGGILARELGRAHPDDVAQVITIVSPFRHRDGDDNRIVRVFARLRPGATNHFAELPREEDRPAFLMPSSAIYSRSDGFVDWRSCQELPGARRENIEVRASHLGAGCSVSVTVAVSERLRQPPQPWRPFVPPAGTRMLFPQFSTRIGREAYRRHRAPFIGWGSTSDNERSTDPVRDAN